MASSYTAQAFIAHGHWSEETRKNPALEFLENLVVNFFEKGDHKDKTADWYTENVSIRTPHAQHLKEDGHGPFHYAAQKFFTEPMPTFKHFCDMMVAIPSQNGWDLFIQCHIFGNVAGTPTSDEKKVKDPQGKEWDVSIPTFYYVDVLKLPDSPYGFKVNHVNIMRDHGHVNDILGNRGIARRRASG